MLPAEEIAKILLEIKAVVLNLKQPFRYTSGILSPIYCDNRLLLSYPSQRKQVLQGFLSIIKKQSLPCDVIAGTATAGIAHAAWIADALNKPMVYVRNKAKEHGKNNQIEGIIKPQQHALVIEDLISTGGSSINAALALRDAGAKITDCLAIFSYDLPQTQENFAKADLALHTLCNFTTLIQLAVKLNYINEAEREEALIWQRDPQHWRVEDKHDCCR